MSVYNYFKSNQLSIFLGVLVFFPTVRLLLIGSGHASGMDLIVGMIPEILFAAILIWALPGLLKNSASKLHLLDKLVIAYFLFNIMIGTYLAHDLKASLYGFRLTYLPMLGYFVCSCYWNKKVDLERLLHGFFQVLVLVAFLGFVIMFFLPQLNVYFHSLNSSKPMAMAMQGYIRMTSILWTPVVFAMLMLSAFCYWTYRYLKTGRLWDLVFSVLTVSAVFYSASRGPMIASIFAFGLLLFLGKNRKWKLILSGVFFLELLIHYLFVPQFSVLMEWAFVSSGQTVSLDGSNTRVGLWTEVWNSVQHNPMGLGLGKAGHVAVQLFPPGTPGVSRASTDGWYFKLMIETGIPALAFYLVTAFLFFISMIRYIIRNGFDFVSVIFAVFVVTGLVNVVSNALDFYLFSYLYWFLLGLYVFKLKQENSVNEESISYHR